MSDGRQVTVSLAPLLEVLEVFKRANWPDTKAGNAASALAGELQEKINVNPGPPRISASGWQPHVYVGRVRIGDLLIYCDDTLPGDTIEIRNSQGRLLGQIVNVGHE